MRYNSSVLFHLNLYMLWTKGVHQSANFQTFDCSHEQLTTFFVSFFKPGDFLLNFASIFSVMMHNSYEVFYLKHYILWMFGWKYTKFLMSYLKPQISFSLNLSQTFSVMRESSSVLFWLKIYMIWTKGRSIKAQHFRLSTTHVKSHQIRTLIVFFC